MSRTRKIQGVGEQVRTGNTDLSKDKIVSQGVDTAIYHLKIEPDAGLVKYLSDLRSLAESYEEASSIESTLEFNDKVLSVLAFSRRAWSLVLRNDDLDVQIGRGGVSGVYVVLRLSSAYLHTVDFYDAVPALQRWCFEVFGNDAVLHQSELHLYRDLAYDLNDENDTGALERGLVKRARKTSKITNGRRLETLMIGKRSQKLHAVLYDKTAEIKNNADKVFFHDIWKRNGWDGKQRVWRLEIRLTREFLRPSGVDTCYDGMDRIADLWKYVTHDWLHHVDCDSGATEKDRLRSGVSAWWSVYALPFDFGYGIGYLVRERKRKAKIDRLLKQAHGCMRTVFGLLDQSEDFTREMVVDIAVAKLIDEPVARSGQTWEELMLARKRRLAAA